MALSAEFDSAADRRAYAVVSIGAAALSYDHARTFFLPFMGTIGATVTPPRSRMLPHSLIQRPRPLRPGGGERKQRPSPR